MDSKVILKAESLDGYLTEQDQKYLVEMDSLYERAMSSFKIIASGGFSSTLAAEEKKVIDVFNEMGHLMQSICAEVPALKVFSFCTEEESHAEASRVIAKLRDIRTGHQEFVYYSQRAYEMLFRLAYTGNHSDNKNYLVVRFSKTKLLFASVLPKSLKLSPYTKIFKNAKITMSLMIITSHRVLPSFMFLNPSR